MKTFLYSCIFLLIFNSSKATTVLASTFGYNATNATTAVQDALNSNNDTIIIDLQTSDWNVGPINFYSLTNKTIIFEKGVNLKAIAGIFLATTGSNSCLLRFVNCNNISIIGYGAKLMMNKPEYVALNDSEFRHCLSLNDCNDFIVKGLEIRDSGGDGIYVSGEIAFGSQGYCNNILIEDVKCINNYRQGLSICSAQNMTVAHCQFSDTIGTLPEAGIDIEPYETTQRIVNLNIDDCKFTNNGFAGVSVALIYMNNTSLPVSIKVTDCYFKNNCRPANTYAHCEIFANADDFNPVQGTVDFERCFIDGSNYTAYYSRKTAAAYTIKFSECVFQNVSQLQILYNNPIFLEVPNYNVSSPKLGGYFFENVLLTYPTNFEFLTVYGAPTLQGLENITGNITVVEPNNTAPLYLQVPVFTNVNYTYTNQTSLPNAVVNLVPYINTTIECYGSNASFDFIRTTSLTNKFYPLGISYATSGTATLGDDTHLLTNGIVIQSGISGKTKFINARNDGFAEANENLVLEINQNTQYTIGAQNSTTVNLIDCNLSLNEVAVENDLKVYPNPVNDMLYIESSYYLKNSDFKITNLQGQLIDNIINSSDNRLEIDVSNLSAGIYFLTIFNEVVKINPIKILKK